MHKLFRAKTLSFQKPRKNFELALYPDYNAPAGHPGCSLLGFSSSTWHINVFLLIRKLWIILALEKNSLF